MSANAQQQGGGIGCLGVLTIVFVVLKLTGNIDWSWWLVLLPFYGPLAIILLICVFLFIAGAKVRRA
jgi:hypothetical protein